MNNTRLRGLGISVSVLALALMLFAAGRRVMRISLFDQAVQTRRGVVYVERHSAREAQQVIDAIQQRVPPGGRTFFYPYRPELFFLTATCNPTRFDVLLPDFHTAAQIDETLLNLRRAQTDFIFSFDKIQRWTIRPHFPDDPPDVVGPHPVERALKSPGSGYHEAAVIADMGVFAADQ